MFNKYSIAKAVYKKIQGRIETAQKVLDEKIKNLDIDLEKTKKNLELAYENHKQEALQEAINEILK